MEILSYSFYPEIVNNKQSSIRGYMKNLILLSACAVIAPLQVNDWNDYPIPAIPPDGMIWELSDMSDDFNYTAPAKGKSEEFHQRWTEGFINALMAQVLQNGIQNTLKLKMDI
ncbi:hypothetical protein [Psychrosphaera algicola]|uniref:Uncharacterized protein n=1 Tax=Psychrosphaera algicola TaxID=3023714 RepID=A0ABT5F7N5_9GAMM|nr:hypothetical protein [Psychrosphaera sp. G1-22]MDC2887547.1 hypothetical protein [Psychrosphaera sp. G1-22]